MAGNLLFIVINLYICIMIYLGLKDGDLPTEPIILGHRLQEWMVGSDLTEGKQLFLSETAGTLTSTAPSDDGDIVQVCGIAIGPRDVLVSPSLDIIEHA